MKKTFIIAIAIILFGLLVWGFINPNGISAAYANNVWSVDFTHQFFLNPNNEWEPLPPPEFHQHARLFLLSKSIKANDYLMALTFLQPMIERSDPIALETYARIQYQLENYDEAFSTWAKIGNPTPILDAYGNFHKSNRMDLMILAYKYLYGLDPELHAAQYAYWLFDLKRYNESTLILNETIRNFPLSKEREKWLRLLGNNYQAQKNWSEAESAYLLIISENPNEWMAWRALGLLYYDRDSNINKTISSFDRAINIDPIDAKIRATLAKDYLTMRQNELAIQQIEIALNLLDPITIPYYLEAGQIYEWSGFTKKALEMYELALQQDPTNLAAIDGKKRTSDN